MDTAQAGTTGPALKIGDLIEITGVGFFDFEHGQSGVTRAFRCRNGPRFGLRAADPTPCR
jgi:hypothetical protein